LGYHRFSISARNGRLESPRGHHAGPFRAQIYDMQSGKVRRRLNACRPGVTSGVKFAPGERAGLSTLNSKPDPAVMPIASTRRRWRSRAGPRGETGGLDSADMSRRNWFEIEKLRRARKCPGFSNRPDPDRHKGKRPADASHPPGGRGLGQATPRFLGVETISDH